MLQCEVTATFQPIELNELLQQIVTNNKDK